MGTCCNCGRENGGNTCYSCGFEVIQNKSSQHDCDCDPEACGHGNYERCVHCNDAIHIEDYCRCKATRVEHAKKYGRAIDVWEAENVE